MKVSRINQIKSASVNQAIRITTPVGGPRFLPQFYNGYTEIPKCYTYLSIIIHYNNMPCKKQMHKQTKCRLLNI